jgi:hypothetical protein
MANFVTSIARKDLAKDELTYLLRKMIPAAGQRPRKTSVALIDGSRSTPFLTQISANVQDALPHSNQRKRTAKKFVTEQVCRQFREVALNANRASAPLAT